MGGKSVNNSPTEGNSSHGQPFQYDPDFNGPIKNRSCTDILCLIIFFIFIAGWIVVAVLAFMYGDPEKLIYPTDSQGNTCGQDKFIDKPVLFFFDLTQCAKVTTIVQGCKTPQICVSNCPSENFFPLLNPAMSGTKLKDVSNDDRKSKIFCKYDANPEKTIEELVQKDDCAKYVLKSDAVIGRCVPLLASLNKASKNFNESNIKNVTEETLIEGSKFISKFLNLRNMGEMLLEDLKNSWHIILLGLIFAMALSLIWIIVMRWLAWFMLWLSILLVIAVLSAGCWYSFNRYVQLKNRPNAPSNFKITSFKSYGEQKKTWLILGIVLAVLLLILLLILIFLRNRIRLAIALVEESSKAVGNVLSTLFFPVIPFILQMAVIGFGLAVAIFISSISPSSLPKYTLKIPDNCEFQECLNFNDTFGCSPDSFNHSTCAEKCPTAECAEIPYKADYLLTGVQIYNLFALFWGAFFVVGFGQMVLAGAFATWYWTMNKDNLPVFTLCGSFYRTTRYHLGSLAFGSLLITIVRMIRVMLEYIDKKLKEYTDNIVAKAIMCCLKCCFWCLEHFMKFINRNAYIMIAIYGKNFCAAAKDAFLLLMRNIARVVILDKVTDFLLFLGKLTIVGGIGILSFFFFSGRIKGSEDIVKNLNYIAFPIIIICVGSYLIASCFFSVYSMAVDTLFLCFLEDCEMNDGSREKPYRMSKNLMKILGKKNLKLVDPDEKNK